MFFGGAVQDDREKKGEELRHRPKWRREIWGKISSSPSSTSPIPFGASSSFGVSELAQDIGRDCYVDLNGWHLFLKDMKPQGSVHTGLANVVTATILKNGKTCSEQDATEILKAVKVPLGGGKMEASLFDLMPKRCVDDFVEIAKKYADDM